MRFKVFLQDCFGPPLFGVVATTVNTLIDDASNPLDANHAADQERFINLVFAVSGDLGPFVYRFAIPEQL